ncbi:YdaS family helix-turn-helix protein [Paraburkholderia aspalathi]|uniref:YdaS family helix-turn-helix protein n=1 Tax=Paraburkholderia aspalathi TaxID=1324617 RepID=UPI00190DF2AC|nr:YdaS family helix-turn-helix protein [Paraburkholderia aspalathi]MBK3833610.1 hypothetical protein [Paraburkholderia aspalathi]MBK3863333.1 hypothetical protein [Paraburkholderia aspalathi]
MSTQHSSQESEAMRAAIRAAGGLKALADRLGKKPNTVSNWINRGVPTEECPAIQELTGVRCEVLRPSIDWEQFRRVLCASRRQLLDVSDDAGSRQPAAGSRLPEPYQFVPSAVTEESDRMRVATFAGELRLRSPY